MPNKNIGKEGEKTRFSSTNQPESNGRKPKGFRAFAVYCEEMGYEKITERELIDGYMLLMQLPAREVLKIAGSPIKEFEKGDGKNEHPAVLRMIAKEFFGKRGQEMIKHLEARAFGNTTNKTEHSGKDGNAIEFKNVSDADLDKALAILEKNGE